MVLLVIDTQKQIMNDKLYQFEVFVSNMKRLLKVSREHGVEVIYVRHDDGREPGIIKGTEGFEIYEEFQPAPGEKIFDKNVNSAFRGTGLLEYLREKETTDIIMSGLQTDYCIDASIKCAFEHGFHVIVPEGANTTVDNEYMTAEKSCRYYNTFLWNGRYAKCLTMDETVDKIRT